MDGQLYNFKFERKDIELFLPLQFASEYDSKNNVYGYVSAIREDGETHEFLYDVTFERQLIQNISFDQFPANISLQDVDLIALLLRLVKDSIILKEGLIIYLKHFAPYFSRIVDLTANEYNEFKQFVFSDVIKRIEHNTHLLEESYRMMKESIHKVDDIAIYLNLEEFREISESEVNLDLFLIAFASRGAGINLFTMLENPESMVSTYRNDYYLAYLFAIKNLEKRLYFDYNQIVLIYMRSLFSGL